jgi:hypothetical protein
MRQTTHGVKKMKEHEQYFPGRVVDIKEEGEETAETYKNSLSKELAEAIRREEGKSD